jgi:hypothetical protein
MEVRDERSGVSWVSAPLNSSPLFLKFLAVDPYRSPPSTIFPSPLFLKFLAVDPYRSPPGPLNSSPFKSRNSVQDGKSRGDKTEFEFAVEL